MKRLIFILHCTLCYRLGNFKAPAKWIPPHHTRQHKSRSSPRTHAQLIGPKTYDPANSGGQESACDPCHFTQQRAHTLDKASGDRFTLAHLTGFCHARRDHAIHHRTSLCVIHAHAPQIWLTQGQLHTWGQRTFV